MSPLVCCSDLFAESWYCRLTLCRLADLDSLTSSLLYAYFRTYSPQSSTRFSRVYVPLLNIPAKDIILRQEFLKLLPHADLESTDLLSLDNLPSPPAGKLEPEITKWVLVDHNKLTGKLGEMYRSRVLGVIDHHDEENWVP